MIGQSVSPRVGRVRGQLATPAIGPGLAGVVPVHTDRPRHVHCLQVLQGDGDRLLEIQVTPLPDRGGDHSGVDKPESQKNIFGGKINVQKLDKVDSLP